MDLEQRIAAELRAELARQERSRQWLARQTGMPVTSIARWLRGPQSPRLNELDAICRALGLTIAELLAAVERNGGYEGRALVGAGVRHQGLEPRTRWFGRSADRRGFMPVAAPGLIPHPRRPVVVPLARPRRVVMLDNRAAS